MNIQRFTKAMNEAKSARTPREAALIMARFYGGYERKRFVKSIRASVEKYHDERLAFFRVKQTLAKAGRQPEARQYEEHLAAIGGAWRELSVILDAHFVDTVPDVKQGEGGGRGRRAANNERAQAAEEHHRKIRDIYKRLKKTDPDQPEKHYRSLIRERGPKDGYSYATISRALRG